MMPDIYQATDAIETLSRTDRDATDLGTGLEEIQMETEALTRYLEDPVGVCDDLLRLGIDVF